MAQGKPEFKFTCILGFPVPTNPPHGRIRHATALARPSDHSDLNHSAQSLEHGFAQSTTECTNLLNRRKTRRFSRFSAFFVFLAVNYLPFSPSGFFALSQFSLRINRYLPFGPGSRWSGYSNVTFAAPPTVSAKTSVALDSTASLVLFGASPATSHRTV